MCVYARFKKKMADSSQPILSLFVHLVVGTTENRVAAELIYIQISMLEDCERLTTEKVQKTLEFCAYVPNLNISPCQRNLLKKTISE